MSNEIQSLDTINLLLIQSSNSDAVLIKANLRCSEHPKFLVRHERTCQAGIDAISEGNIDLIVLDLTLPDSVGLKTLQKIRKFAVGMPIVVIAEMSDEEEIREAITLGAQDCFEKSEAITKPLGQLLRYSVERFHHQHAQRDIASAAFVQKRLFPKTLPPIKCYDVSGRCDPANHVGGDYFDYFIVDDDQLIFVIGDVTGHGFGPSLVMAETRAALRTMAAVSSDIGKMIGQINNLIYDHNFHWFVTLFVGKIDTKTGRCCYASAGQPALLRRADGSIEELSALNHPLGIEPGVEFGVLEFSLGTGDTLLLHTDGITERSSGRNELFGIDRLGDLLMNAERSSANEMVDLIFDKANQFAEDRPSVNDMTAVVIKSIA